MARFALFALNRFKIKYSHFLNVPGDVILCYCLGSKRDYFVGVIQIKEIEFNQDDRGWFIRPITDDDIKSRIVCDIHMVSMKPGAIRGNYYHVQKTENVLVIGSACRVVAVDNCTKKKEERRDNKQQ